MADRTGISWCDHTHNIWIGCTKVSEGCKLCYAERDHSNKWAKLWGPSAERHRTTRQPMLAAWDRHYWKECGACGWRGESDLFPECPECKQPALRPTRQRVFVNSLSDIFEDRADLVPWRNEFWALTQMCTGLDFLLLTKRPENARRFMPKSWSDAVPPNIWLGVSVENQRRADERISELVRQPAAVRWLSVEPMLEAIDLRRWLVPMWTELQPSIDWVVCGGESGPGCRPLQLAWARALRDQCHMARVPFYMKQLGGAYDRREALQDLPTDLRIRTWPRGPGRPTFAGGSLGRPR